MAKSKDQSEDESLTFLGESVDPEIQKKVDSYMELGSDESNSPQEPTPKNDQQIIAKDEPTSTAPLLPSDKLPTEVKASESTEDPAAKIQIKHFDEEEPADELEPSVSEPEIEVPKEPAEVPKKPVEDEPLDSELIDLTQDPDMVAAPGFEESEIDKTKTIGELSEASKNLDDPKLDQAINEIVAEDADKLLEVEDQKTADDEAVEVVKPKKAKNSKDGNFIKNWFKNPLKRKLTIWGIVFGLIIIAVVPTSRYFVLNTAGVRVSTSMKIIDDKTSQPLKNAELVVDGKSATSDINGDVKLERIKLGKQEVIIKKPAFAEAKRQVTFGWGSNPLGEQRLTPVGAQYTFNAKDFVSEKPVGGGEVTFGEFSARMDDKGQAILVIEPTDLEEIEVVLTAENYRTEKVKVPNQDNVVKDVKLVPAKKHVFVSKRSGKFDVYKIDVDGKNEEVILKASGIEKEDSLSLSQHPTKPVVAFSSTRENTRNKDGFLLSSLNIIYLDNNETIRVAQSERIQIIDWSSDNLVYVKITEGASEANTNRHKLMSYNFETNSEKELASTNYFNDVASVNGVIYYSPALYKVNGKVGLYKINADGTNKKQIYDKEVWNMFRSSYDKISMSVGQEWYELNLASDEVIKVGGAPSVLKSRVYINSPNQKNSIWVDERDGKSVLINYALDSKKESNLISQSGIKNPIYWLSDNHVIYRISDGTETADYIMSLSGGEPKKIKDVTDTVGVDRWYYF